jgi:lipid-binding SYLF domain-containing protein
LFAGISLTGATLRQDLADNEALYGKRLDNKEIVKDGAIHGPASSKRLLGMLNEYSDMREHKGDNN